MHGITVVWGNPEKTTIVVRFIGKWTWTDYAEVRREQLHAMLDTVDYPVHHIYDVSLTNTVPKDTLTNMRLIAGTHHANFSGLLIIAGANKLVRATAEFAARMYLTRMMSFTVLFADNVDDANARAKDIRFHYERKKAKKAAPAKLDA